MTLNFCFHFFPFCCSYCYICVLICYICVLMQVDLWGVHLSSYCYMCVLMQADPWGVHVLVLAFSRDVDLGARRLPTRPHTPIYASSYCCIGVLILLYVSSCCYVCVLILLYMCPHAGPVLNQKLASEIQPGALVVSWYMVV